MYDPKIGRWLSEDPSGFAAGDANLYRYVGNSPVNFVDPSGETARPIPPQGPLPGPEPSMPRPCEDSDNENEIPRPDDDCIPNGPYPDSTPIGDPITPPDDGLDPPPRPPIDNSKPDIPLWLPRPNLPLPPPPDRRYDFPNRPGLRPVV